MSPSKPFNICIILYDILISLRIEVALYKKEYKPLFPYIHFPLPRICVVFLTTINDIDFPGKHIRQRVIVGTIDVTDLRTYQE